MLRRLPGMPRISFIVSQSFRLHFSSLLVKYDVMNVIRSESDFVPGMSGISLGKCKSSHF